MDTYNYINDKSNFLKIDRCEYQYRIYLRNCSGQSKLLVPEYKLENPGNIRQSTMFKQR